MSPEEQTERAASPGERALSLISQGAQALADLSLRIAPHFGRVEVRRRGGRYLQGLLASVERKNGWQLAEELGEESADGVQGLWTEADWDDEAVRDDRRGDGMGQLG